jgi:glutathione reductase (NADPH)
MENDMASYDYDLFVMGAGSGGVRAARVSASFGAKVAVAEDRYMGGTCVNVGCIPKKLLVYASHFSEDFHEAAAGYGWTLGDRSFDWSTLIANKDKEISRLQGIYDSLLSDAGAAHIEGRARVTGPNSVAVGDAEYTAKHILVATGGWPSTPDVPGIEHAITSNEVFHLPSQPKRLAVVGGGYIAVELAGVFNGLGSDVTQLYRGPLFLRGFDGDVRSHLAEEMRKKGIDLRFDINVSRIEKREKDLQITLTDGSQLDVDQVLYATGRSPLSAELGLEEAGVELAPNGAVVVDEYSSTNVPSIHAIGDVSDRIALTPVAIHEGICLANTLFNDTPMKPDHEDVASAVFSQPPVGSCGVTEEAAREKYAEVDIYRSSFRALKHTLTAGDERTLMKLIVDRASDRVVGLHVVGPDAGEMLQGFAVAIKCRATKAQFDATMAIHPTSAEELVTMREPVSD